MSQILEQIKIGLLLEQSLEFVVESHEEVSLCEGEGGDNESQTFLKLTGTFQKGNVPNGNKRIYKTELLSREVERFQSRISSGLALGKVYHPGFFDNGGPSGVTDVSHRITKLWMEGDVVKGELLVFKTASGTDVEAIIEGGGKIGISSRGYGSMKRFDSVTIGGKKFKEMWVVDDNYRLETFDLVLTPSVKSAIMHTVKENTGSKKEEKKADNCNVNLSDDKGGIKSMTLEELKAQHPAIYNEVYEAGVADGRRLGATEAKSELNIEHDKVVEEKNSEISTLKSEKDVLTSDNVKLKNENKELTDKNVALESEKTKSDIKEAVTAAVNASEFKEAFGDTEIADICRVVSTVESATVEDAKKEVESRIKVIESVIAKRGATKKTESGKNVDTSEDGSSDNDTDKANEEYLKQQRQASGL